MVLDELYQARSHGTKRRRLNSQEKPISIRHLFLVNGCVHSAYSFSAAFHRHIEVSCSLVNQLISPRAFLACFAGPSEGKRLESIPGSCNSIGIIINLLKYITRRSFVGKALRKSVVKKQDIPTLELFAIRFFGLLVIVKEILIINGYHRGSLLLSLLFDGTVVLVAILVSRLLNDCRKTQTTNGVCKQRTLHFKVLSTIILVHSVLEINENSRHRSTKTLGLSWGIWPRTEKWPWSVVGMRRWLSILCPFPFVRS